MKNTIKCFFIMLFIINLALSASPGETGYNYIKLDSGNRAIAMGGAYAGVSEDIISLYYNPAGLAHLAGRQFYFLYRSWLFGTDYMTLAYSQKFNEYFYFGLGFLYFSLPEVNHIDYLGVETGQVLSGNDYTFIVSLAGDVFEKIRLGINFKLLNEAFVNTENHSIVFDIGLLREFYSTPSDSITAGLVLQNWNTKFSVDPDNPVPVNLKLGAEYTAYKDFTLNFDINKQIDLGLRYNIGAEYKIMNMVALRAGYKIGYDLESFTFGLGFDSHNLYKKAIFTVDYSLTSLDFLSQSQNISLKIRF
ncbi:MAG: PorV/PorQ family protein [Spirochaetes bacterium]|nr:PorV/PorQ family protein [Spirochaetota bacterium]